ncbi:MAG: carboxypeptidase-like regulatory domain-containing protein [Planctomycetota bacterium]|nr:carboxypeptidase-like regulatory domain-containing protein [Planctomycetota bacterium]
MQKIVLVALVGAGLLLLGGGVLWLVAARDDVHGPGRGRALATQELPEVPAELSAARPRVDLDAGDADAALAARQGSRGRHAGIEAPIPDALRSVRGRVVDAQSGEPLANFKLGFLSRRPRNIVVVTDAHGEFVSDRELASGVVALSHQPDVANPLYAGRYEIEPSEFLLPRAGEDAPAFPLTLSARSPRRIFEVDVRRPDGAPASDATVALSSGRRDERGAFVPESRDFEIADALGRARFALFGDGAFQDTYRLEAEQGGTLVAEPREFDPPLPSVPERVDLFPGGVLSVRVKNDEGRGVPAVSLWLSTPDAGRFSSGRRGETDANGEYHFTGLRDTCWTVSAVHPFTGDSVERAVDLGVGEYADVDLRLSVANLRLGAQGTVVDERGDPLLNVVVHVQAAGSLPVELETDAAGQFQYWGHPSGALLLGFGGAFLDDRFEPGVVTVPFGATSIAVRRVERRGERSIGIEIVDRQSHAPCPRAAVWLSRPESAALVGTLAVQRFSAPSGVAMLQMPLGDEIRYAIDAPGYLRAEGAVADLLDAVEEGRSLRVELVPGFERKVEVRDRVTRALLSDAVFFAKGGVLGATDGAGRAALRADDWPAAVRVECTGYAPLAWDPLAAGWPGTVVWLDPLSAR